MHHRYMIGARLMIGIADIDEQELERLVALFYARVRADEELGPIFNDAIDDWPEHLEKLVAFWSSVVLTSGRYKGNPMAAHLKHRDRITPASFRSDVRRGCKAVGSTCRSRWTACHTKKT